VPILPGKTKSCPAHVCAQVCSALGQIAKHSVDLAEVVVEAEVFPKCLTCLRYPDEFVQQHAATLVSKYKLHPRLPLQWSFNSDDSASMELRSRP